MTAPKKQQTKADETQDASLDTILMLWNVGKVVKPAAHLQANVPVRKHVLSD